MLERRFEITWKAACCLLTVGLCLAPAAQGAKRLGPPSSALRQASHIVVVAEARLAGAGRLSLRPRLALFGQAPTEEIVVRVEGEGPPALAEGETYVVGYTAYRQIPLLRGGLELDPDGPRVLELPGVGPAWFADTPQIRLLVTSPEAEKRALLDAIFGLMAGSEPGGRRFAVLELALRPGLHGAVTAADLGVVQRELRSAEDPMAREFLLQAARDLAGRFGGAWLAEICRAILAEAGTEYDLTSYVPQLVLTAVQTLEEFGGEEDVPRLAPLLHANNPGVAKAALGALDALAPAAALARALAACRAGDLHPETRRALGRFLEDKGKGSEGCRGTIAPPAPPP